MGSVYCQCSLPLEPFIKKIEDIFAFVGNRPVYAGADVNAKSTNWGGRRVDHKIVLVETMLDDGDFSLLNDSWQPATFSSSSSESWIDIAIGSRGAHRYARNWRVHMKEFSDHRLIMWTLASNSIRPPSVKMRPNWRKANWRVLSEEMEQLREESRKQVGCGSGPEERLSSIMRHGEELRSCFGRGLFFISDGGLRT